MKILTNPQKNKYLGITFDKRLICEGHKHRKSCTF